MSRPKNKPKFPKQLMVVKNKEKEGKHEAWTKDRDMLNIPHPARVLLLGGVNSGKTLTVKNILARAHPPFRKIYLYHCGGEWTTEYDEIDYECIQTIPTPSDTRFDGEEKTLLIVEDKAFDNITREEKKDLSRLFGYMSTHRNISIYMTSQNFFDVPAPIRRMANFFILWRVRDEDLLKTIGRRVGLAGTQMIQLAKEHYNEYTDSLWFDNTPHSPYPVRKNGYERVIVPDQ